MPETLDKARTQTTGSSNGLVAHYAKKTDITRAHVHGTPVRALCGIKWIPTRDGSKYPICMDCQEIYSGIPD